jgi:hypothetical protein
VVVSIVLEDEKVITENFRMNDIKSYKEHMMNALVPVGDEGRDKLR